MKIKQTQTGYKPVKLISACLALFFLICSGCNTPDGQTSLLLYRLPYQNGTSVEVRNDHLTHSPKNRLDLEGKDGRSPYAVVAAQSGQVAFLHDSYSVSCCGPDNCPNNYVWLRHLGGEYTKYSHLEENSVTVDAGLSVGDWVVAGTFLGYEGKIGTCSRHCHFEVQVPTDPNNPLKPGTLSGYMIGTNRIPRFCDVPSSGIVEKGKTYTAKYCELLTQCMRSQETPSTAGSCTVEGISGNLCVQELQFPFTSSTYERGVDFESGKLKIDLSWCANSNCDGNSTSGQAVMVVVIFNEDEVPNQNPIEFIANCRERRILETVDNVQSIRVEPVPNLHPSNTVCGGNDFPRGFARWEICELPSGL